MTRKKGKQSGIKKKEEWWRRRLWIIEVHGGKRRVIREKKSIGEDYGLWIWKEIQRNKKKEKSSGGEDYGWWTRKYMMDGNKKIKKK